MKSMSMQQWMLDAYNAERIAIETDYEQLMKQEQAQHIARMDAYAAMQKAALARLDAHYGVVQPPPEKTMAERANYEENTAPPL